MAEKRLDPRDEPVVVVDDHNRPIGVVPRARMRAERLAHRATYVFVFDHAGKLLAQKRTANKDVYPGYWDAAAGGVVVAGESWDESAAREAAEELGIEVPLEPRLDFYYEDEGNRCFGRIYTCVYEGPFRLQAEEVEHVEFVTVGAIRTGALEPITPDTLQALELLLRDIQSS